MLLLRQKFIGISLSVQDYAAIADVLGRLLRMLFAS